MKEAYVKLETAKLLKEKGFDWDTDKVYERSLMACRYEDYPMPTQQMAMRWLREEKGIHIYTVPDLSSDKFYVSIAVNVNSKWRLHANFPAPLLDEKYIKCEDAIEAALEYVLTNLI